MSANIGSVELTIRAIDEASAALDRVKTNISGLGTVADTTTTSLENVNKVDYTKTVTGISGLVTVATGAYMAIERVERAQVTLDKANLRVSNDTDLVAKAQDNYNEKLAKFGADSPEVTQAVKDLGQAIEKLRIDTENAALKQNDLNSSIVFAGATAIPTSITAIASLKTIIAGLGGTTATAGTALGTLGTAAATAGGFVGVFVLTARGLWDEFGKLKDMIDGIGASFGQFNASMMTISNPFAIMAEGVIGFLKDLGLIPKELPSISDFLGNFYDWEMRKATECWDATVAAVKTAVSGMTAAIGGFIQWLKDTFQGFYNFLVGGSLWVDLWNAMIKIAMDAIAQLSGAITSALIGGLQAAFAGLFALLQGQWEEGWHRLQSTAETTGFLIAQAWEEAQHQLQAALETGMTLVQAKWTTDWNAMLGTLTNWGSAIAGIGNAVGGLLGSITGTTTEASSTTSDAMTTVQGAITGAIQGAATMTQSGMGTVATAIQSGLAKASSAASSFWNWLVGGSIWPEGMDAVTTLTKIGMNDTATVFRQVYSVITGDTTNAMLLLQSQWEQFIGYVESIFTPRWQAALTAIQLSFNASFQSMGSICAAIMNQIVLSVNNALKQVQAIVRTAGQVLVYGSIWPDMLETMQSQTATAMDDIVGQFGRVGLAGSPVMPRGTRAPALTSTSVPSAPSLSQQITIPVAVRVDSQLVAQIVEKRLISASKYGAHNMRS